MHWSSKHRILNSINNENQRSFSSKNSTRKTSDTRGSTGMRIGSIGCTKPHEVVSSRNIVNNENHVIVNEPTSLSSKNMDGLKTNYNRVFGRDITNITETRSFAEQPSQAVTKEAIIKQARFGSLRNNVSSSDMFHINQTKKVSIDPPSSDSQRNLTKVNYKCAKNNRNLNLRSSNLSKNRSNSGIRNSSYLKSTQFLQSNNQSSLQNFHSHISNVGNVGSTTKNFNSGARKMSINQLKTVSNLENPKNAIMNVDRSSNYTSLHSNKQSSFRQSYVATGNTSNSNIVYNHYTNINNYSSLTNSSSKPINVAGGKETGMNALNIAKKSSLGSQNHNLSKSRSNRSNSMSQGKSISRKKIKRSSDK